MFSSIQLAQIWGMSYSHWGFVQNGKAVSSTIKNGQDEPNEEYIPLFEKIYDDMIMKIECKGFSVERTSPKKANCVLRIYRDECVYVNKMLYWIYGAEVYLKINFSMMAQDESYIDYSKCNIICKLLDPHTTVEPHFSDYYLILR